MNPQVRNDAATHLFRQVAASPHFDRLSLIGILATAVAVGFETSSSINSQYGGLLKLIETWLLWFFIVEALIRFIAAGPRYWDYFSDGWNVFDVAIIAICLLPIDGHFAVVVRLARVLRILRVVRFFLRLRIIVSALLNSMASMAYIALLLSILFYIYAVLGVFMFGGTDPGHFGSLSAAFLTLFQIVTLEGWVEVMRAQMASGKNAVTAPLYFVSFIIIGTMIVLNLFIGTIVGSMTEAQQESDSAHPTESAPLTDLELTRQIELLNRQAESIRLSCEKLKVLHFRNNRASNPGV